MSRSKSSRRRHAVRNPGAAASGARRARRRLERVLVLADGRKEDVHQLLAELEPWLAERVAHVKVERDVREFYKRAARSRDTLAPPDAVVVMGGDGAILAAVRALRDTPVPTLGINFGRVGFLAAVEASTWREALQELVDGRLVLEPRMRVEALFRDNRGNEVRALALNDVVLTRGAFQGMLTLSLSTGGTWVADYRADGLIVSTPAGSTAYSLAAGGPLLAPSVSALVVTPICPQALSHRAIVLDAAAELELTVTESSGVTTLVVDGQGFFPVQQGDRVRLRRHSTPWPLLARPGMDPYQRWRERLGWRGNLESDVLPSRSLPERTDEGDAGGAI